MPDPAWPSSPPEVNHLRLVGAGAGGTATTLASGVAWQVLTASNEAAATASSANTAVTALDFTGVGGAASQNSAHSLNTALHLLAGWAQEKPPIAASAVSAYETAVSSMIPAEVSLANRSEHAANVALNPLVLGALTPAIVALDAEYFGEHWPHNASIGIAYGTALSALTAALSVPAPPAPLGVATNAPAAAAAAVAQTVGQTAGEAVSQSIAQATTGAGQVAATPAQAVGSLGQLSTLTAQPLQAAATAVQPVTGMFNTPLQALGAFAGIPYATAESGQESNAIAGLTEFGTPIAGAIGQVPGGVAGTVAVGSAGAVQGAPGAGLGGLPNPGLTSYSKPTNNFGSDSPGRPTGPKLGLLSGSELAGPVTTATTAGVPLVSGPSSASAHAKGAEKEATGHARVIVGPRQNRRESQ